jgi:hypothetical protein
LEGSEISQLINELETRVERLRALYDQYFVGIERLEPLVLRKDVDRRLWTLRREQIRNTALRFKLETTFQRYNTYQQYWQRIVREIENGTYQRDLGRAMKRFGESATTAFGKRRQKMFEKGMAKRAEREAGRTGRTSAPPPLDSQAPPALESYPSAASNGPAAAAASSRPPTSVAPETPDDWDVPIDLELELLDSRPPPPPAASPPARQPTRAVLPLSPRAAPPPPRAPTAASTSLPQPAPRVPAAASVPQPRAGAAAPQVPPRAPGSPTAAAATNGNGQRPRTPAPPAAASPPKPADSELSPQRLRQIYGQYVEAKRRANESTAALTFEKVAANLRQTAQSLREKHRSHSVDFEVVLKNGKPAIKPIVKG